MKKFVIGVLLLTGAISFAYQKNDLVAKGLNFIAPQVKGKTNVGNPQAGEIIFDTTDSQFYGRDSSDPVNGHWIQFSSAETFLPPGLILPYGGSSEPNGYYFCDGRALLIADNKALYDAIKTSFGDGTKNADNTNSGFAAGTAFNLPDTRGRFLRGVSGSSGRDPEASIRGPSNVGGNQNDANLAGTIQGYQMQKHSHTIDTYVSGGSSPVRAQAAYITGSAFIAPTSEAGGTETRPLNISVNYIIKR